MAASQAYAVPELISYQGKLTSGTGTPVTGMENITFGIYNVEVGGIPIWTEAQTVNIVDGVFSVLLGSANPIDPSVFNEDVRFLGVQVGSAAEMTPRKRIASVGYAMTANNLGGGAVVVDASNNVGISTTPSTHKLDIASGGNGLRVGNKNSWFKVWTAGNSRLSLGDGEGHEAGFIASNQNSKGENVLIIAGSDDAGNCPVYTYFHESGNVGIGVSDPGEKLQVNGTVKATKFIGDGSGLTNLSAGGVVKYFEFTNLNYSSVTVNDTWTKLITTSLTHSFTKVHDATKIEVHVNSRFDGGIFNSTASGIRFQVRIDDNPPDYENQGSILTSNTREFLSILGVFEGLPAGNHTVSLWAMTPHSGSSSSSVCVDPSGRGGSIIGKEIW